MKQKFQFKHMN